MKTSLHLSINDFMFFPNRLFGRIAVVLNILVLLFSAGEHLEQKKKHRLFDSTPLMVWAYFATKAMTTVQSKLVVFRLNCFDVPREEQAFPTYSDGYSDGTEKVALIELSVTKLSYLIFFKFPFRRSTQFL